MKDFFDITTNYDPTIPPDMQGILDDDDWYEIDDSEPDWFEDSYYEDLH